MQCANCGMQNYDWMEFCSQCGSRLSSPKIATQTKVKEIDQQQIQQQLQRQQQQQQEQLREQQIRSYYESIFNELQNADEFGLTVKHLSVEVYLDTNDSSSIEFVNRSVAQLIENLGFTVSWDLGAIISSWFKRLFIKSKDVLSQEDVKRRLDEVELGLKTYLDFQCFLWQSPDLGDSEKQPTTQSFNLKNIRTLLIEGFTDEELRRICYDELDFRPVYEQLTQGIGKASLIDKLIEHTERKELIETLLVIAKERNPNKYEKHQPYHVITANPTIKPQVAKTYLISKQQSEVDKNQAEAVSTLVESLSDTPNAIVKIGSLLLVKKTDKSGTSGIMVKSLSIDEMIILAKRPELLGQPNNIFEELCYNP